MGFLIPRERVKVRTRARTVRRSLAFVITEKKGCTFGDSCRFKHDRAAARKQGRCLACGQEGHYRPDCTVVSPEHRPSLESGNLGPASPPPKSGSTIPNVPPPPPKAKGAPQAKSLVEDERPVATSSLGSSQAQEALMAEAAKLLKNVFLPMLLESRALPRKHTFHSTRATPIGSFTKRLGLQKDALKSKPILPWGYTMAHEAAIEEAIQEAQKVSGKVSEERHLGLIQVVAYGGRGGGGQNQKT